MKFADEMVSALAKEEKKNCESAVRRLTKK
jgi:hypothetical protein